MGKPAVAAAAARSASASSSLLAGRSPSHSAAASPRWQQVSSRRARPAGHSGSERCSYSSAGNMRTGTDVSQNEGQS